MTTSSEESLLREVLNIREEMRVRLTRIEGRLETQTEKLDELESRPQPVPLQPEKIKWGAVIGGIAALTVVVGFIMNAATSWFDSEFRKRSTDNTSSSMVVEDYPERMLYEQ